MRNKQLLLLCASMLLCMSALTGCSERGQAKDESKDESIDTNVPINSQRNYESKSGGKSEGSDDSVPDDSDADLLISRSVISGHVVSFSDTGCSISPAKEETVDGGSVLVETEPGYENEEDNVNIHYQEGCRFQLAVIRIQTGKVELSDVDISDIKKLTSLIIYGEESDDHNISATRVIIARYE